MTVKQLKKLLRKLPDEMQVLMPHGDDALITVCFENSDLTEIELDDDSLEIVLLLVPCNCSIDDAPIDLEINPN